MRINHLYITDLAFERSGRGMFHRFTGSVELERPGTMTLKRGVARNKISVGEK